MSQNDLAVYGSYGIPVPDENTQTRNFGGSLKQEYYASWAIYMTKFVQAYLDEGIPVTMLTLQNETVAATIWAAVFGPPHSKRIF
jgi:O-Glycosyl hydrolase